MSLKRSQLSGGGMGTAGILRGGELMLQNAIRVFVAVNLFVLALGSFSFETNLPHWDRLRDYVALSLMFCFFVLIGLLFAKSRSREVPHLPFSIKRVLTVILIVVDGLLFFLLGAGA
jgi:hypothetical protein